MQEQGILIVQNMSLSERTVIYCVGDIGDVVDDAILDGTGALVLIEAEIITVLKIEGYVGCRNCNSTVEEMGGIGECTKCGLMKQQVIAFGNEGSSGDIDNDLLTSPSL